MTPKAGVRFASVHSFLARQRHEEHQAAIVERMQDYAWDEAARGAPEMPRQHAEHEHDGRLRDVAAEMGEREEKRWQRNANSRREKRLRTRLHVAAEERLFAQGRENDRSHRK